MRQAGARTWKTLSAWAFFSLVPAILFKQLHGTLGGAVGGGFQGALSQVYALRLGGERESAWAPTFTLLGTALLVSSLDTEGTHKIV